MTSITSPSKRKPTNRQILKALVITAYIQAKARDPKAAYEEWKERHGISHLSEWTDELVEEKIQAAREYLKSRK